MADENGGHQVVQLHAELTGLYAMLLESIAACDGGGHPDIVDDGALLYAMKYSIERSLELVREACEYV